MVKDQENESKDKSAEEAAERIKKMLDEGKRIVEDAHREARELKRQAREERRTERRSRHKLRHHRRERKKEKVLNLRIGKDLEEKIKAEAERIDMPVSNLVRNILEDTFELVEGLGVNVQSLVGDVVENAENIAGNIKTAVKDIVGNEGEESDAPEEAEESAPEIDPIDDVPAWQDVTAGKAAICAACEAEINRGDKAHMGVSDSNGARLFLCGQCMDSVGIN